MDTQALFCLVQPYQLLQKNNVNFLDHGNGHFNLTRDGHGIEVKCGIWAAIWMNNYIRSQVKGVNLFPLDFSQDNALSNIGRLGKEFPVLASTFKGVEGLELDMKMAQVFASSKVELGNVGSKIENLKTAYIMDTIEPYPAHEFFELTEEGLTKISLGKEAHPEVPYYMAIDLKQFKNLITDDSIVPPKVWASFIVRERLHWNLHKRVLYLSNAYSAKLGLPPNHEILGFNMALEIKDWEISVKPVQNHPKVEGSSTETQVQATGDWEKIFGQFMANPNLQTFSLLRTLEIRRAFKSFKNTDYYNYGSSRKYKLTTVVLEKFAGPAMAATFSELAQAVEEVAGGDPRVQFCLLMKLEGQVKQVLGNGQDAGKFYFGSV